MFDKILWICPTRNRPEKLQRMLDSWKEQSEGLSDMLLAIDSDDRSYDSLILNNEHPNILWEVSDPIGGKFLHLLNKLAVKYADQYKYIGFMEDDCVFRTPYESKFIEKLEQLGINAVVHGNDQINTPTLISLPLFRHEVIQRWQFMAPYELNALWADHFWRKAAYNGINEHYFPDIIIQHLHYSVTDNLRDSTAVNLEYIAIQDFPAYHEYIKHQFYVDMEKLK